METKWYSAVDLAELAMSVGAEVRKRGDDMLSLSSGVFDADGNEHVMVKIARRNSLECVVTVTAHFGEGDLQEVYERLLDRIY
jgi:hypothetical protein